MKKKPKGFKSRNLPHDSIYVKFVDPKDGLEIIRMGSWDSHMGLTVCETIKLFNWLKKAVPYIKKVYKQ